MRYVQACTLDLDLHICDHEHTPLLLTPYHLCLITAQLLDIWSRLHSIFNMHLHMPIVSAMSSCHSWKSTIILANDPCPRCIYIPLVSRDTTIVLV